MTYWLLGLGALAYLAWTGLILWRERSLQGIDRTFQPRHQPWIDELAHMVAEDQVVTDYWSGRARTSWEEAPDQARRHLDALCEHVTNSVQVDLRQALTELLAAARSVPVLASPRPLAVAAFRLLRLRGLRGVAAMLEWAALTGKERVQVRIGFYVVALRTACRLIVHTARPGRPHAPWPRNLDPALEDLGTVEKHTLETAGDVLAAVRHWELSRIA